MKPYVVCQGDYLDKVAHRLGFDAESVWGHPANDALRAQRKPNLLHPGDVLQVPDTASDPLRIEMGTTNAYRAKVPKVTVQLVFVDADGPRKDEPYEVGGIDVPPGKTGQDGKVTLEVPVNVRELILRFPERNVAHVVHVGDMDPIEEVAGVDKRLRHLGHLPPGSDPEQRRERAVREFQAAQGLPATGVVDDATRAALLRAHGS